MGHYCIDQGADLIIGHHPHVLQGIELYHDKPIFYSLGNFIFDQRYGPATESIFLKVTVNGTKMKRIDIVPVIINQCVPEKADPKSASRIRSNLLKYSEMFGLSDPGLNF
jgi:poly-gamma-glutamate synthesis protein (capsule biosynthesis protein)